MAPRVGPAGAAFLGVTCVMLPYLAIRTAQRLKAAPRAPTARQHLLSVLISQGFLVIVALATARVEWIELFPAPRWTPLPLALAAVFVAIALGTLPLRWRWRPLEDRKRSLWLYPRSGRDVARWALVSLLAGTCEEIVYRGVMFALWYRLFGSWWPAAVLSSLAFAVVHWTQGVRTVLVIAAMALCIHGIVLLSGDLLIAMALHVAYDFFAGLLLLRCARRDGLLEQPAAAPA